MARASGKDEKTVRDGVKGLAEFIGLQLRPSDPDKHPGRPIGAKNKTTGSGGRVKFKESSPKQNNAGN
jgi:hypothetical protein